MPRELLACVGPSHLCTKLLQASGSNSLIVFHLLLCYIFFLLSLIYFNQSPLLLLIFCVFLTREKLQDFDGESDKRSS